MEQITQITKIKRIGLYIIGVFVGIILLFNMFEDVGAGEIVVIQSPITGELTVKKT